MCSTASKVKLIAPRPRSESTSRILKGRVRSGPPTGRDEIHRRAFGGERDPLDRRIDVHIAHVRKKLGLTNVAGIRTVHRVGYVLEIDPDT